MSGRAGASPALFHLLLLTIAVFVLVPFIWIIAAGFKTQIS
jgi:ABC-type glycerol-3-phosphate transport system permease component